MDTKTAFDELIDPPGTEKVAVGAVCTRAEQTYGHPGYRYGIWDIDMGDDSIDTVILDIDMGYLVTLVCTGTSTPGHYEQTIWEGV